MRSTSLVGEISRTQIIAALTRRRKRLLAPLADHLRYDLVIDDEGTFLRIQCKTGRLLNGAICFCTCSIDSRSKKGTTIRRSYRGEIEFFAVYCPENGRCYLVPVDKVGPNGCRLRIAPPRNGQKTHIRWAEDYELE